MNKDDFLRDVLPRMKKFLAARERCSYEIISWLKKNRLEEVSEIALEYLGNENIVNDERFVNNRIDYRIFSGYGPLYVEQDLIALGFPSSEARRSIGEIDQERWIEGARNFSEKKKNITSRQLYSRGFGSDIIAKITGKNLEIDYEFEA